MSSTHHPHNYSTSNGPFSSLTASMSPEAHQNLSSPSKTPENTPITPTNHIPTAANNKGTKSSSSSPSALVNPVTSQKPFPSQSQLISTKNNVQNDEFSNDNQHELNLHDARLHSIYNDIAQLKKNLALLDSKDVSPFIPDTNHLPQNIHSSQERPDSDIYLQEDESIIRSINNLQSVSQLMDAVTDSDSISDVQLDSPDSSRHASHSYIIQDSSRAQQSDSSTHHHVDTDVKTQQNLIDNPLAMYLNKLTTFFENVAITSQSQKSIPQIIQNLRSFNPTKYINDPTSKVSYQNFENSLISLFKNITEKNIPSDSFSNTDMHERYISLQAENENILKLVTQLREQLDRSKSRERSMGSIIKAANERTSHLHARCSLLERQLVAALDQQNQEKEKEKEQHSIQPEKERSFLQIYDEKERWFQLMKEAYERQVTALEIEIRATQKEASVSTSQAQFWEKESQKQASFVADLEKITQVLRRKTSQLESLHADIQQKYDMTVTNLHEALKTKDDALKLVETLREDLDKTRTELHSTKNDDRKKQSILENLLQATRQQVQELISQKNSYVSVIKEIDQERNKLKQYIIRYETELKKCERKVDILRTELRMIKQKKHSSAYSFDSRREELD